MSRIGKKPIKIPEKVTVQLDQKVLTVKGPLGKLTRDIHPDIELDIDEKRISVKNAVDDDKFHRALLGTVRSVVSNMVVGVSKGFTRELLIHGMGYKAELKDKKLRLSVGLSHPVEFEQPEGIQFVVEEADRIIVKGSDKEKVGEIAAEIRSIRKPEPYKGKGIRYRNEHVRRKAGKVAV
jgi:large subunit ribosomal protein L6